MEADTAMASESRTFELPLLSVLFLTTCHHVVRPRIPRSVTASALGAVGSGLFHLFGINAQVIAVWWRCVGPTELRTIVEARQEPRVGLVVSGHNICCAFLACL